MADIPGLIEGASQGAGLGHRFLKHLTRTGILLHIIDVLPMDGSDPILNAKTIIQELAEYDQILLEKPRWLVLNKIDLLGSEEEREKMKLSIVKALKWKGPVYCISAISGQGTDTLCYDLMDYLETSLPDRHSERSGESSDDA
jgi:GTP-binding protein